MSAEDGQSVWALVLGQCRVCGKLSYATRKAARLGARRMTSRTHGARPRAYLCPAAAPDVPVWHLGHLPAAVVRGGITRSQLEVRR